MMGVGKSMIGKNLGEVLDMQFIDIDNLIEEEENLSISKIFKIKGEEYFRKIEKKITLEILKDGIVVLTGSSCIWNNKQIKCSIIKHVKQSLIKLEVQ